MRLNRYKMGLNQDRSNTKIVGGGGKTGKNVGYNG